jgi:HK97 family phage prohead protease
MLDIAERANSTDVIRRSYTFTEVEFRDDGPTGCTFEGVASVVDAPYTVRDRWGEFEETIRAGAFNKTLRDSKADVGLFTNHDYRALPMATRASGRLTLAADPHLRVRAELNPARPSVQEARHAVLDGDAGQMSIGFTVPKARDKWSEDMTTREISEVVLKETSIVWQGANPFTSGKMRSLAELMDSLTDVEMDPDEVRRAIDHLTTLLPDAPAVAAFKDNPESLLLLQAEDDWALRLRRKHALV